MSPTRYPNTLPTLYSRAFLRGGDRRAVTHAGDSRTYADLEAGSAAVATGLRAHGVEPGDRVAVFFGNRVDTPVVDAAIARAGAVRVPLNPMYSARQVDEIVRDAGVGTLIVDPPRARKLGDRRDAIDPLARQFVFDDPDHDGFEPFETLREAEPLEEPTPPVSPDDRAAIYYTSGTTGRPKGVVYTHRGLVRNLLAHLAEFDIGADDVGLLTAPLSHSAGTFLWTGLLAGGRVVIQDGFDVKRVVAAIEDAAVTWTMAVPTMLYRLLEAPEGVDETVRSLDRIYYGTAPARAEQIREAVERFGPIFVQFYGQTEVPNLITTFGAAAHAAAVDADDIERLRAAGTPALQVGIRIVDTETGSSLPSGTAGEVVVAAPYAFTGYHDRPDATAATLEDGWVHTGDIGRLDDEGFLTLLDRKGDVVTTGGMNVYTREIEAAFSAHPDITDVAVIGIPDEEWGEAIHAVVVPDATADLREAEVDRFVAERLAGYKRPKSIEIRSSLPRTSLGKIDRESIRREFWTDVDRSIH